MEEVKHKYYPKKHLVEIEEEEGQYTISIPLEVPESALKFLESYLSVQRKILRGHFITSTQGVLNKIKFYLLGYAIIEKENPK